MTDIMPSDTSREPRPEKVAIVAEVKERLRASSAVLLTEYRGLKVSELAALRTALSAAGGDFKIYKNTLVRLAVRDLGVDIDEGMLTGPTAIAFVEGDAAGVAKALRDYARTNPNLIVRGGILGSSALSADEAQALADLPSREVLLARLAGGLAAPLVGLAGLLQALPRSFAYGLKALIDQRGGPVAPAAETTDVAPEAETADEADTTTVAPATKTTEAAPPETTDAAPAAETTEVAPAAAADTEDEAAPAATTDTPEEAS